MQHRADEALGAAAGRLGAGAQRSWTASPLSAARCVGGERKGRRARTLRKVLLLELRRGRRERDGRPAVPPGALLAAIWQRERAGRRSTAIWVRQQVEVAAAAAGTAAAAGELDRARPAPAGLGGAQHPPGAACVCSMSDSRAGAATAATRSQWVLRLRFALQLVLQWRARWKLLRATDCGCFYAAAPRAATCARAGRARRQALLKCQMVMQSVSLSNTQRADGARIHRPDARVRTHHRCCRSRRARLPRRSCMMQSRMAASRPP